jgi:hypothetical protein
MAARLGHVLYWIGCLIGGGLVLLAIFIFVGMVGTGQHVNVAAEATSCGILAGIGIIVWAIGLACRYVLAGPKRLAN